MATKDTTKKPSKLKPLLIVVGVLVGVYLLLMGAMVASDWYKIGPYKALATEIDQTLGGGFKISYNWRCELESSNCPSAHMSKDSSKGGEVETEKRLKDLTGRLDSYRFKVRSVGRCNETDNYGYCRTEIKDNNTGLIVNLSLRPEMIFIDIQS